MNAKLAEIGAELRQAREAQKLSLDDLAHTTLMHVRHLTALEEGRVEDLPEPFYIKNFIRKYANALGLQGDEFAHRYWDTRPLPPPPPVPSQPPGVEVSWWAFPLLAGAVMLGIVATLVYLNMRHAQQAAAPIASIAPSSSVALASSPAPAASAASTSAASGQAGANAASALAANPSASNSAAIAHPALGSTTSSEAKATAPGLEAASQTPSPGAAAGTQPRADAQAREGTSSRANALPPEATKSQGTSENPAGKAALAAVPAVTSTPQPPLVVRSKEIIFQTRTTEPSWMDIIADGHEVQSDVVPAGKTRKWTAKHWLEVRIGNPGAVYGNLDGRSLGPLGPHKAGVFTRKFVTASMEANHQGHPSHATHAPARPQTPRKAGNTSVPAAGSSSVQTQRSTWQHRAAKPAPGSGSKHAPAFNEHKPVGSAHKPVSSAQEPAGTPQHATSAEPAPRTSSGLGNQPTGASEAQTAPRALPEVSAAPQSSGDPSSNVGT